MIAQGMEAAKATQANGKSQPNDTADPSVPMTSLMKLTVSTRVALATVIICFRCSCRTSFAFIRESNSCFGINSGGTVDAGGGRGVTKNMTPLLLVPLTSTATLPVLEP